VNLLLLLLLLLLHSFTLPQTDGYYQLLLCMLHCVRMLAYAVALVLVACLLLLLTALAFQPPFTLLPSAD
jgi:hypothetical protein